MVEFYWVFESPTEVESPTGSVVMYVSVLRANTSTDGQSPQEQRQVPVPQAKTQVTKGGPRQNA